ncbi:MAG: hypothetical protein KDB03_05335 [Planctomycetales bacterium]|nr:hypothetical protein [Planctomycetales bacterium]
MSTVIVDTLTRKLGSAGKGLHFAFIPNLQSSTEFSSYALRIWVLTDPLQAVVVSRLVARISDRSSTSEFPNQSNNLCYQTHNLIYLSNSTPEFVSLLVQSGAQSVIPDIPSLQNHLTQLVDSLPTETVSSPFLSAELIDRLPWGHGEI